MTTPEKIPAKINDSTSVPNDQWIEENIVPLMSDLLKELKDIALATEEDKDFRRLQFPTDGPNGEMGRMMQEMSGVGETPSILSSREFNAKLHRAASALIEVGEKAGKVELALLVSSIREAQSKRLKIRPEAAEILRKHYPAEIPLIERVKKPKSAPQVSAPEGSGPTAPPQPISKHAQTVTRRGALALIASGVGYALYSGYEERKDARSQLKQMVLDEIDLESKGPAMTVEERKKLLTLQRLTRPELEDKASMGIGTYALGTVEVGLILALLSDFTIDLSDKNTKPRKKSRSVRSAGANYPEGSPAAEVIRQLDDTLQEASLNGRFNIPARIESTLGK